MDDELIRLDATIIGIDNLINKASTAEEAKVLFTVKDVIYSQQRYFTDVHPVKHGRWLYGGDSGYYCSYARCSLCEGRGDFKDLFCKHCGAKMDGDAL